MNDEVNNAEASPHDPARDPGPSRLHEIQGQTLRASMAAHGVGSLLMELARLASSVHVAGAAAPAPAFLNDLFANASSSGPGSAGDRDPAASLNAETRGVGGVSGETAFLAPPLVYLDRGRSR